MVTEDAVSTDGSAKAKERGTKRSQSVTEMDDGASCWFARVWIFHILCENGSHHKDSGSSSFSLSYVCPHYDLFHLKMSRDGGPKSSKSKRENDVTEGVRLVEDTIADVERTEHWRYMSAASQRTHWSSSSASRKIYEIMISVLKLFVNLQEKVKFNEVVYKSIMVSFFPDQSTDVKLLFLFSPSSDPLLEMTS